ncbi:ricin-type beta-trefoil lectin domain protein [Actinacidiphila acididurans]|uniref:Ricin-type beta-trefoil lectin domain protein n=1 Tax=Actinacidiphila acididurans TaxID=2784346 RepID=A0ABS2TI73_9ACTN|nr:ricin-type beta-trefoil lectin domain protein [Actinacidiphila acididurans]MBM9503046.1 ricin-type beta-trefoil lectin domain protein [Actinacidiphila acididurans]
MEHRQGGRRYRLRPGRLRAAVACAALLVAMASIPSTAAASTNATGSTSTTSTGPTARQAAGSGPWTLSTTDPSTAYTPTFIGNGYLAARVPAEGTGLSVDPITTESELAGFYADPPAETNWSEIRADLPTWTTLGVIHGADTYGNLPVCRYNTLCQAAAGELSGGATPASDHGGAMGRLFAAGLGYGSPNVGATVTVPIAYGVAGASVITIRYANGNGASETVSVGVDGGAPRQVTLPPTANWDTWGTVTVPATLNAGDNDVVITVGSADSGQVNVDTVAAYPVGAAAPTTVSTLQAGTRSGYRQTLDMLTATLTTSFTWTAPSGRTTDFTYTVNADQSDAHVGMVGMSFTPHWTGQATVVDALDERGLNGSSASSPSVDTRNGVLTENVTADGTGVTAAIASVLRLGGAASPTATAPADGAAAGQSTQLNVVAGTTYTATKFVGIASSDDGGPGTASTAPQSAALSQATAAANLGAAAVTARNEQAWSSLWSADISVPGDDTLTGEIRAAMFYLLESNRADVPWPSPPGGLSSDSYNGHVFWDMETWMYPALLAQHPEVAEATDTYRQALLGQAEANAATCAPAGQSVTGARYPWESGITGRDAYHGPGAQCDELHVSSDIALAQWQYYLATGDTSWLAGKAWPVLRRIADFWVSRAVRDPNVSGAYRILDVMGPDEYHDHVDDSAYTDAAAQAVLTVAARAAQITGNTADLAWTTVASGLQIPFDSADQRHLEYDGYPTGQTIKQADVTMLQYPWSVPMPGTLARNDLDYYSSVTDLDGPSMTDSIAAIDAAALPSDRCDAYTYLERSVDPFVGAPFDKFHETRTGGAFTFTTAAGGFLQELEYGFTGLRWDQNAVLLDPSLPPQIPELDLSGLRWHGSTYSLSITPTGTTITVTGGPALPVSVRGTAARTVSPGTPLTVATRTFTGSSNAAACKPVTASHADLSHPAEGAIDGAPATAWYAAGTGASLTIDLGAPTRLDAVQVQSDGPTTAYTIEGSDDGTTWTALADQAAVSSSRSTAGFPTVVHRYIRYQAGPSATARIAEITVPPAVQQIRLGAQGLCTDDRGGLGRSGDAVQAYFCNGTSAQGWTTYPDGSIRALGLCLDVQGGGAGNGTPVQLYTCNNTAAQQWQIRSDGGIVNPQSGRCLTDPASGPSGTQLDIEDCDHAAGQTWVLRAPVGRTLGYQGMCLDVRDADPADYNPVQVYTCNDTFAQQWTLASDYTLRAYGMCLDVNNAGTAAGTAVDLYWCNGTPAQQWQPQAGGELVNPNSGMCLTDPGYGPSATRLDIEPCTGATDQIWSLP